DDQGHAKLFVKNPGRTLKKGYRDKNGCHYQGDGYDGSCDLAHRLVGRFPCISLSVLQLGVDRFHDHNRVIHDDPDRQEKRKEGEQVNTVTQEIEKEKGTYDRYRHSDGRNQGRSKILQEDKNHQKYQQKSLEQGDYHLIYRGGQEIIDIEIDQVFYSGRKIFRQLLQFILYGQDNFLSVGTWRLIYPKVYPWMVISDRCSSVGLGSKLDIGHIAQSQKLPTFDRFDDDILKFFLRIESPGISENILKSIPGIFAQCSRSRFTALLIDGFDHIGGDQIIGSQAFRQQPDPHRINVPSERPNFTDPGDSLEFRDDIDVDIVLDEFCIVIGIRRINRGKHQ